MTFRNAAIDGGEVTRWVIRDRRQPASSSAMSVMPRKRPTAVSWPHVAMGQFHKWPQVIGTP